MTVIEKAENASCGERIRMYRTYLGLTQRELSEAAEIGPAYLSGVERGLINIGIKNLMRLAQALGVTTAHLTGEVSFLEDWPQTTDW